MKFVADRRQWLLRWPYYTYKNERQEGAGILFGRPDLSHEVLDPALEKFSSSLQMHCDRIGSISPSEEHFGCL